MGRDIISDVYAILSNDWHREVGCMRHPSNLLQLNYDWLRTRTNKYTVTCEQ